MSPSRAVAGSSRSCRARVSPAADSSPDRPSSSRSAGTPIICRAGSLRISPRLQIRAAVVPGATRSPASPAARIRSVPSGRRASNASAPTSTAIPATSDSDSLPPTPGEPSSTTTSTGSSRRKNAAASPAMPPPPIATTGRAPGCSPPSPQGAPAAGRVASRLAGRGQGRLGLAKTLLGVLNPPRQQVSLARQRHRTAQQPDSVLKIPSGHLGLAQRDQSARDPPRIAQLLAQGERVPQLPHRLFRADVLDKVAKAQVPVDLRAPVQVAALLYRLGQAKRRPEVRHRSGPVAAQDLEHQTHAEQRPRGARRVTDFLPDGQGTPHQLLFGGHVGIGRCKATADQLGDVAVMMRHAQAADGEGLSFPVAIPLG